MRRGKNERVLNIYQSLQEGKMIQKKSLAFEYEVDTRTIQRDIDEIRGFLQNRIAEGKENRTIVYDRISGGFKMIKK